MTKTEPEEAVLDLDFWNGDDFDFTLGMDDLDFTDENYFEDFKMEYPDFKNSDEVK